MPELGPLGPVHLPEDALLSLSCASPVLVPTADPTDDISEDRGSEADSDARGLGEPLVKRERSDPAHPLQGI